MGKSTYAMGVVASAHLRRMGNLCHFDAYVLIG